MKEQIILVVEDNPDNYALVEKILGHAGFQTANVSNAKATKEWCRTQKPVLIFMDINLPDSDGLTLIGQLREIPEYNDVPIIMHTAHVLGDWEQKSRDAGCTDFLAKPYRPRQLIEIVEKYITQ